jgi:hypothetical protein
MAVLIGGDTGETWWLRGISHFLFIYFNPSYFLSTTFYDNRRDGLKEDPFELSL